MNDLKDSVDLKKITKDIIEKPADKKPDVESSDSEPVKDAENLEKPTPEPSIVPSPEKKDEPEKKTDTIQEGKETE